MDTSVKGSRNADPQIGAVRLQGMPASASPDELRRNLLLFVYRGERPSGEAAMVDNLLPVHLHVYRDFARFRSDYPLFVPQPQGGEARDAAPLRSVFERVHAQVDLEGDDLERFKRDVLKAEVAIRDSVEQRVEGTLGDLWSEAAESVAARERDESRASSLRTHLDTAKALLQSDGDVLGCDETTPARLTALALTSHKGTVLKAIRDEVEELAVRLEDILEVDRTKSKEAIAPAHLQQSMGSAYAAELDFRALSDVLDESRGQRLPEVRRVRIVALVETLRARESLLRPETEAPIGAGRAPSPSMVLEPIHAHRRAVTEMYRAIQMARLEVDNAYREEKHDGFFERFSASHLRRDEIASIPCGPFWLRDADAEDVDLNALMEVVSAGVPVKIVLTVANVVDNSSETGAAVPFRWRSKIAQMMMATNQAFVSQTTLSSVEHLIESCRQSVAFSGPSLLFVYVGSDSATPSLHPYLRTAAALESRVFPAFIYDPDKGSDWASRFRIDANPQADKDWPIGQFKYQSAEGDTISGNQAFTFAEFASLDMRFANHFMPVSPDEWHEDMLGIAEYMNLPPESRVNKLPFIRMSDENGMPWRVLVTREIATSTLRVRDEWLRLRELGGIENSHARRLLEQEKARLAAEKDGEVKEIMRKHEAEIARTTGELAQEIVSNIAAALLNQSTQSALGGSLAAVYADATTREQIAGASQALEAADAVSDTEPEVAAEVDEEEPISLEEAYIETRRCTSCDECTAINSLLFAYDENKQAYIKDLSAGTYRELVLAAEKCPVRIIHPGKPLSSDEPGLDELVKRAEPFQ